MKKNLVLTALALFSFALVFFAFPNHSMITNVISSLIVLAILSVIYLFIWFRVALPTRIFIGLILGVLAGLYFGPQIEMIKPVGTAFLRLIKMIVVPLIFASLVVGAASLGDIKKIGRIGVRTLIYFLTSTTVALAIGLLIANTLQPGKALPEAVRNDLMANYKETSDAALSVTDEQNYADILLDIIPENPIRSMSQGIMLQVIFFALMMGIAMSMLDSEKMKPVRAFFEGINDIMTKIVHLVIQLAPYGVFALIASVVGSFGADILLALLNYAFAVILGQILLFCLYPLAVQAFGGASYGAFLRGMRPAQLIAFSTSSSSATLPVTIQCVEENLGIRRDVASFVLPLGATINMDGTALFQGVSAVFIAQVYGLGLSVFDQLGIVLTAVLASIGTAGAPGVGVLMLVIVLKQIGIPLEGIALILGVERILDMFRTTMNVTSDATATSIVAFFEKSDSSA